MLATAKYDSYNGPLPGGKGPLFSDEALYTRINLCLCGVDGALTMVRVWQFYWNIVDTQLETIRDGVQVPAAPLMGENRLAKRFKFKCARVAQG